MAEYPGAIPTFVTVNAAGGDQLDTTGKEHDALHNKTKDEIIAIATALGINPATISDLTAPDETSALASQAAFNDAVAAILKRLIGTTWRAAPTGTIQDLQASMNYQSNDVQRVQVPASVTGGTFTVQFMGVVSGPIAWDADAATWDAALEAMSTIGAGNITPLLLGGSSGSPSHLQANFSGAMAAKPWPTLIVNAALLTGPGAPYSITTNHITIGGKGHNHNSSSPGEGGQLSLAGEVTGIVGSTFVNKISGKQVWSGLNEEGEAFVYFNADDRFHAAQVARNNYIFIVDNPVVGDVIDVLVPVWHNIRQWTAFGDAAGSVSIDVWRDTYANYPPTSADKISATAPITLVAQNKNRDSTLTGWNKANVPADRVYRFAIQSVSGLTKLTVNFEVTATWF